MRKRSTCFMAVLVFAVSTVIVSGATQMVSAAETNCDNFDKWLYGAFRLPSGVTHLAGAQADVVVRQNNLCQNAPSDGHKRFSNAWAMLAGTGANDGYAQIGYERHTGGGCGGGQGCREFFAAYLKNTNQNQVITHWGNPNGGTFYVFKTTWQDGSGQDDNIHMIQCDSTNDNPPGGTNCVDRTPNGLDWNPIDANWAGTSAQWAGETNDPSTDMPGTDANRELFRHIKIRDHSGGGGQSWYAPSSITQCTQNPTGPSPSCSNTYFAYHWGAGPSGPPFEIWTNPVNR